MKKILSLFVLITTFVVFLPQQILATQNKVIFSEDFSQNLDKWQALRDDGSMWKIVNGKVRAEVKNRNTVTEIIPKDEYWTVSAKNFEYELDFRPIEGIDKNISFSIQDERNWYEFHFNDDALHLQKIWDGQGSWSKSIPFFLRNGTNYHIKITFNNGNLKLAVDGAEVFNQTDPTFNNNYGKVGIKASTAFYSPTIVEFDNIIVRSLDPTVLNVTSLSQNDELWGDSEYDNASSWVAQGTPITFDRWACKLIAEVMLLHFHGFTTLPDGSDLTPLSYNEWLTDTSNYNRGQILTNSVSKLTNLFKTINQESPRIEQKTVNTSPTGDLRDQVITELESGNPVVLKLHKQGTGDHFVLATGVVSNESKDIYINDPEELHPTLSSYTADEFELTSIRMYTPSHTDLSRISILADIALTFSLTNMNGTAIPDATYSIDGINNPVNPSAEFPKTQVLDIAQPKSGQYVLTITSPIQSEILFLADDTQMTASQKQSLAVTAGTSNTYTINYFKTAGEGRTTIEKHVPVTPIPTITPTPQPKTPKDDVSHNIFGTFLNTIQQLVRKNKISNTSYVFLKEQALLAQQLEVNKQKQILKELERLLDKKLEHHKNDHSYAHSKQIKKIVTIVKNNHHNQKTITKKVITVLKEQREIFTQKCTQVTKSTVSKVKNKITQQVQKFRK